MNTRLMFKYFISPLQSKTKLSQMNFMNNEISARSYLSDESMNNIYEKFNIKIYEENEEEK